MFQISEAEARAYYTGEFIKVDWATARALGLDEAVFLAELLFWHDHSKDGWIFRTQEQIEHATCLPRKQQERVRNHLKAVGILVEDRRGVPARMYYRVSMQALFESKEPIIASGAKAHKMVEHGQSSMSETDNLESPEWTDRSVQNGQTSESETDNLISRVIVEREVECVGAGTSVPASHTRAELENDPALSESQRPAETTESWRAALKEERPDLTVAGSRKPKQKQFTSMTRDWSPTLEERSAILVSSKLPDRFYDEALVEFRANRLSRGKASADWFAEFEVWCVRKRGFLEKDGLLTGMTNGSADPYKKVRRMYETDTQAGNFTGTIQEYVERGKLHHLVVKHG